MAEFKDPTRTPGTYRKLRFISKVLGILILFTGFLVIVGWMFGIERLKSIRHDTVAMNPATAICFILAGAALNLLQEEFKHKGKKIANWLAGIILTVGAVKLFSLILHYPIPFDQVLFKNQLWNPGTHQINSMAPNTAINFFFSGLALLLIDYQMKGYRRPSQYLSIVVTLLALLSLYGYLYGIETLYSVRAFIPMAMHTAFCFLALGAGILFARPDKGSMAVVIGENSGQIIFMRFIAFVLPLLYGWLKIQGENAGLFSKEFGTALFAILTYIVAMFFLARQSILQHKIRETKRQAIEVIRQNELRLQAILDHSATNISLKSLLGKYTLVNKQFQKDFNIESEHVIGKTDYDLFTRELAKELNQYDHQIIKTGQPKSFEEKYPQKDGLHTYLTVKFPLFNQDQKIYALGAVSLDITKRKHLEEELRKSHQRLFGILDNIGEGVIVVDKDGNLLIFNRRAEEILGTGAVNEPLDEWNKAYGFFQEDGLTYFSWEDNPLFKAVQGETADNVEMLVKNEYFKEGKWIAVTGRPVLNEKSDIIAGVIVFRDITLRKQLERLFSENEHRLKLILSSIGEGVIIIDQQENLLLINNKAEEILGKGPKNLPITKWPEYYGIYLPDGQSYYPTETLPFNLALQGKFTEEVEVLVRNKNLPEGKNIFISGKPVRDSNGIITGAIIDFKDITEQRKLEEYLKEIEGQFHQLLKQQRPAV